MKKITKKITLLLLLAFCLLATTFVSFLTILRKYRFYLFTVNTVTDIKDYFSEKAAEASGQEVTTTKTQEYFTYVSDDGSGVSRKEPWYYMNRIPGEEIVCDVGYRSTPVYISFTPRYTNGYLYPDGTQEEMSVEYAYEDVRTGEKWYSKNPYRYKNLRERKYYELTPYDNPLDVRIRFTAKFESGLIYPDGKQEEVY